MTRERTHRGTLTIGYLLLFAGICLAMLTFCSTANVRGAEPSLELARYIMGYANGKDCCKAGCSTKPTLAERTQCCAQVCPQFVDDCVDACISGWPRAKVIDEISIAGKLYQRVDSTSEQRSAGKHLLEKLKDKPDPTYSRLAKKLLEVGA